MFGFNKQKPDMYFGKAQGPQDPYQGGTYSDVPADPEELERMRAENHARANTFPRAPHNPHQQLVTKEQAEQRTALQLVEEAGMSLPALMQTMNIIAERLELNAQNTALLNRALGEFKQDVMVPFKEELKYLRHVTGDKLNHVSTDLEKYVQKLDKVLWGALRAQGMSDAAIRDFRTEYGMTPETPRGFEIENHIREVEEMKATIVRLTEQNRRLIATPGGHTVWSQKQGEAPVWVYDEGCQCTVCVDYKGALASVGLAP